MSETSREINLENIMLRSPQLSRANATCLAHAGPSFSICVYLCGTECGQTPGNWKERGNTACREEVSEKGSVTHGMKVKSAILERKGFEQQHGAGRSQRVNGSQSL